MAIHTSFFHGEAGVYVMFAAGMPNIPVSVRGGVKPRVFAVPNPSARTIAREMRDSGIRTFAARKRTGVLFLRQSRGQ